MQLMKIYTSLLDKHGCRGWWPLTDNQEIKYHPGDYSYPKTKEQQFEICVGAILTQNTSWKNVEKALLNLKKAGSLDPKHIISSDKLEKLIKPSGYFNQKAKKLRIFSKFFIGEEKTPARQDLLNLWGVGKETADSMLLYAFKKPVFVVDAYTRRLFGKLGLIDPKEDYDKIRHQIEKNLEKDYKIFQEFHALIVTENKPG